MFGRSKRIKDLEEEITGLKSLCAQLTSNSLQLTKEYSLLVGAVKSLLQHQKIIDRIISTKYDIDTANDDDDIIH
jgi:hypothetical protein|tara:strand:+ start:222 stop:446 length:225 start_codon:yes stop_codon:yes gene_type:complete